MKKWKVIALIPAIVFLVIVFFLPNLLRLLRLRSPIPEYAFLIIGLTGLVIFSYFLFRSKKIFLFVVLGLIFSLGSNFIVSCFWKSYPQISIFVFPLFLLLAFIFFAIATFMMFKDLFKRIRG
jgi:hypothetical protein